MLPTLYHSDELCLSLRRLHDAEENLRSIERTPQRSPADPIDEAAGRDKLRAVAGQYMIVRRQHDLLLASIQHEQHKQRRPEIAPVGDDGDLIELPAGLARGVTVEIDGQELMGIAVLVRDINKAYDFWADRRLVDVAMAIVGVNALSWNALDTDEQDKAIARARKALAR
jgi:hypothetical protein